MRQACYLANAIASAAELSGGLGSGGAALAGPPDPRTVRWHYIAIPEACECGNRTIFDPLSINR